MSDLVSGIEGLAAEIGTQMAATRDLANGLSVTAEKVRDGVDASADVEDIKIGIGTLVTNSIAPVSGRLPVNADAATATLTAATSWNVAFSDSQLWRRFFQLMFPEGLSRATATATASGLTTLTGISPGRRIVITRIIVQLLTSTPVTILYRSAGTATSTVGQIRLLVEGDYDGDPLLPPQYIRLAPDANFGVSLSVASSVYVQVYFYTEDPATGLPIV